MGALRRVWGFRYLVADDSSSQRKLTVGTLKAFGARQVRSVGSGSEALEAAMEYEADVILLDWFLPDMTGEQVIRTLSSINLVPQPAVVVMTSLPTMSIVARARDLGAVTVIRKPFGPDVLMRTLVRVAETTMSVEIMTPRPAAGRA